MRSVFLDVLHELREITDSEWTLTLQVWFTFKLPEIRSLEEALLLRLYMQGFKRQCLSLFVFTIVAKVLSYLIPLLLVFNEST